MNGLRQGRTVLVLALAATVSAGCQAHTSTPQPTPTATPSASPAPSPTPSPSASPSPTPSASPSPTPSASPSPTPSASVGPTSGAAGAAQTLRAYEDSLLAGNYQKAWNLLSSTTRSRWASVDAFAKDRTSYIARAGTQYTMEISPSNTLSMSEWLVGMSWASKIDQKNAFLFSVRWSGFGDDPSKAEIWIANPIFTGWELYLLT
jgi:hypothetical protein